ALPISESVDRLELVADEKELAVVARKEMHELALQPVRVLALVDHDRAEPPALALADLVVLPEELAREELQVLEVERGFAVLRGAIGPVVGEQQLLQLRAIAHRQRLEGSALDCTGGVVDPVEGTEV